MFRQMNGFDLFSFQIFQHGFIFDEFGFCSFLLGNDHAVEAHWGAGHQVEIIFVVDVMEEVVEAHATGVGYERYGHDAL